MRRPADFLHTYKGLQLLLNELTSVVRPYLLMILNNMALTLVVGGQIILIKFHSMVTMESILCILILVLVGSGYLIITYFKFGEIHEFSLKCIGSWERNDGYMNQPQDRLLLRRYVRSLRLCKVDLGNFGCYRKANSLRIIGKVIYYTTKSIMLIQKLV